MSGKAVLGGADHPQRIGCGSGRLVRAERFRRTGRWCFSRSGGFVGARAGLPCGRGCRADRFREWSGLLRGKWPGSQVLQFHQVPLDEPRSPGFVQGGADDAVRLASPVPSGGFVVVHGVSLPPWSWVPRSIGAACRFARHSRGVLLGVIVRSQGSTCERIRRPGNKVVSTGFRRGIVAPLGRLHGATSGAARRRGVEAATVHSGSAGRTGGVGPVTWPGGRRAHLRTTSSLVAPPAGLEPAT